MDIKIAQYHARNHSAIDATLSQAMVSLADEVDRLGAIVKSQNETLRNQRRSFQAIYDTINNTHNVIDH